jgi:hypothetical protein
MKKMTTTAALIAAALPLAAAGLAPATAAEAPAARAAKYVVTATINKSTAIGGEDIVKIRGKVTPKAVGQKVVLQQRLDGKKRWAVSGTAKVKPTGKFVLKDDPSTAGTRFYRVVKPAAGGVKAGVSKELQLVVYTWDKLVFRAAGANANLGTGTAIIGATNYAYSLFTRVDGTQTTVEYTLGDKCLRLKSTYALTDASASTSSGSYALAVDGVTKATAALGLGTIVRDQVTDVTDAFRIRYDFVTTPGAFVAAASPQVLCTK